MTNRPIVYPRYAPKYTGRKSRVFRRFLFPVHSEEKMTDNPTRLLVREIARLHRELCETQAITTDLINDLRAAGVFNRFQRSPHRSPSPAHTEDDIRAVLHGKGGNGK
jgi:hypothetical protein